MNTADDNLEPADIREAFLAKVRSLVAENHMLDAAPQVLVGFSGGADSTALVLAFRHLGLEFTAVHLDHGLRSPGAEQDAAWCRDFCQAHQVVFELHELNVPAQMQPGEGIEAAARRCRLQFWQQRANDTTVVALAHHADDVIEDLFLRLARGSNASGLTGLRPCRTVAGVRFIRPLLDCRREGIEAFLRADGIHDWCEDETNADTRLRRNAVRHEWLPPIRATLGTDQGLRRSIEALAADADLLEQMAEVNLSAVDDPQQLRQLHPALLPRVLRLWLSQQLGRDCIPRHDAIQRLQGVLAELPMEGMQRLPLEQGLELLIDSTHIKLAKSASPGPAAQVWAWAVQSRLAVPELECILTASQPDTVEIADLTSANAVTEYFDAAALPEQFTVRSWRPGDRMVPFGQKSQKKVKDLMIDANIPPVRRRNWPVVLAGNEIVWVPGVRRAEFGRVKRGGEEKVVRLRLQLTETA